MLSALACVALAAAPLSLALPGLGGVRVDRSELQLYGEVLSQRLADRGVKVVSSRDIAALLGMERERQLMGCSDSGCVAELAGALGVDGLLSGDVGLLDGAYVVTLKVLSAKDAQTLARFEGTAARASELPELLGRAAAQLARQLGVTAPSVRPSRLWAALPAVVTVVALSVGAWAEVRADESLALIVTERSIDDARQRASEGRAFQAAGHALLGVGAAAALATASLLIFGESPVTPTAALTPTGGSLGLAWSLP